jgi:uncharacterized lipoprotein YajG
MKALTIAVIAILIATILFAGCTKPAPVTTCVDKVVPTTNPTFVGADGKNYTQYDLRNVTVQRVCTTVEYTDSGFDRGVKSILRIFGIGEPSE